MPTSAASHARLGLIQIGGAIVAAAAAVAPHDWRMWAFVAGLLACAALWNGIWAVRKGGFDA